MPRREQMTSYERNKRYGASHRASESNAPKSSKRERRRLLRLSVSGILLVMVVAVKLLMPDVTNLYREKLLKLMGENTNFVEAFSAVGRAFSGEGGIRDTLVDAYTAVFGPQESVEAAAPAPTGATVFSGVYDDENLPQDVRLTQETLGFTYASPIQGPLGSPFGYRIHPISGNNRFHYGIDLEAEEGSCIRAFADGTIGVVGESTELGNYVTVNHRDGFSTLYAHCKRVTASAGQRVQCGDILAEVGQTGQATGPHLHFEMQYGKYYLNPVYYV